jgi:hypothetical protein
MATKKVTKTIWKWVLSGGRDSVQVVQMPVGAKVVFAKDTTRGFKVWAEVNPNAKTTSRGFLFTKTGEPLPKGARHLGSFESSPTYHIFEVKVAKKTSRSKSSTKLLGR